MANIQGVGLRGVGLGLASGVSVARATSPSFEDIVADSKVAYSLRDIGAGGGQVIRVREDTFNVEQDFTAEEIYDGTLQAFCRPFGVLGNGFVTTWYDQSGNGNDVSQPTTGDQPQLVTSGVVNADGVNFTNSRGLYRSTLSFNQPATFYLVAKANSTDFDGYFGDFNNFAAVFFYTSSSENSTAVLQSGTVTNIKENATNFNFNYYSCLANTTNSEIRRNGNSVATGNIGTNNTANFALGTLLVSGFATPLDGNIKEFIAFDSNSSDFTEVIEDNFSTYYGI